jgi:hypothetical protein
MIAKIKILLSFMMQREAILSFMPHPNTGLLRLMTLPHRQLRIHRLLIGMARLLVFVE